MPADLTGHVALITGAARGIGRSIALTAARAGADLALLDVAAPVDADGLTPASTPDDLARTAELVAATGRRAVTITADVRDHTAMMAAAERTAETLGGLHLVAVNAGIAGWTPLLDMTPAQWNRVIDINLTGAFHTISATAPYLRDAGYGRIVATASVAGRRGMANIAHYAASKWGLIGLVKSAALELGPFGITVNAVAPTLVETPMTADDGAAGAPEPASSDMPQHALPVAAVSSADVADAVAFLFSDSARHISGTVLDINAGASATYTA